MRQRKISCIRRAVPVSGIQVTIPDSIGCIVLQNVGTSSIAFNFGGDGDNDYWTLKAGAQSPTLNVVAGQIFRLKAIGSPSTVEAIVWR